MDLSFSNLSFAKMRGCQRLSGTGVYLTMGLFVGNKCHKWIKHHLWGVTEVWPVISVANVQKLKSKSCRKTNQCDKIWQITGHISSIPAWIRLLIFFLPALTQNNTTQVVFNASATKSEDVCVLKQWEKLGEKNSWDVRRPAASCRADHCLSHTF